MRYLIIANPVAGKGLCLQLIPSITASLQSHQLDFEIVQTERPGHAIELARQAALDGYDVVVAAGGDGTVNEVINGLALASEDGQHKACLAVIPVGRGNDFAFGMGVPHHWQASVDALAANKRRPIDIGRVVGPNFPDGRYLGNGVGIGFDTIVGFVAAKLRLRGMLAYLVAAIKTIFLYYRAPLLEIELDDRTVTQPAIMVSIMNGRRMGGSFMMAPQSLQDDGLFDLCVVGQVSRMAILGLMPKVMNGTQYEHPAVKLYRSSKVKVTALNGSLPAHADGETVCEEGKMITMEIEPSRLDIVVAG
jgi:YegS/Rv2252/BmrU family lipid kinase